MLAYLDGNRSATLCAEELRARALRFAGVALDVGTGDGRYVRHLAARHPELLVVGVDASRDALRLAARKAPDNALLLAANALEPPETLAGLDRLITQLTIHFPWGSLLDGLLHGHPGLLGFCAGALRPGASVAVWLNAGALAEAGYTLEAGARAVRRSLWDAGIAVGSPEYGDARALRACPTTWAHRLAFGRDPRALVLRG